MTHVRLYSATPFKTEQRAAHGSWVITNGTWPADPAYYRGRFSKCVAAFLCRRWLTGRSGPVWPEFVANHLQIGLRNYAVGGGVSLTPITGGSDLLQPLRIVRRLQWP